MLAIPHRAAAQCEGWECYHTPTPSPTGPPPTPTPTGTRVAPSPTPTGGYSATGTPVPMGPSVNFPKPNSVAPTAIPGLKIPDFIDLNAPIVPTMVPLDMSNHSITRTLEGALDGLLPAESDIMSYTLTITGSGEGIDGVMGQGQGLATGILSYTDFISGEIDNLRYTDEFTISVAPAWYAPSLPREMANIGWTFETLGADGKNYSINSWAELFGASISMPFKMVWDIYGLFRFLGPFGLFVAWLMVMGPMVLGFDVLGFLIRSAGDIWGFAQKVYTIVLLILGWLWNITQWALNWTWQLVSKLIDWIMQTAQTIADVVTP